jgi:hypothetical protein
MAIGKNPVLLNGKLLITPNDWVVPIGHSAKDIRDGLEKVRTENNSSNKNVLPDKEDIIKSNWCSIESDFRTLSLSCTA